MPEPLNDLRVALVGNTDPAVYWATEREYIIAWVNQGADVAEFHEKHAADWDRLIWMLRDGRPFDLIQWTSTRDFRDGVGRERQLEMLMLAGKRNIPVIGVHLDQFAALQREKVVRESVYFRGVDVMFTADGGSQGFWDSVGVNHRWLLPAISERWIATGELRDEFRSDIAFVGSWQGGYHREFAHRHQLVDHLQRRWGDRVRFWPRQNHPRIVGHDLNDLYWSTKVVIGDAFHVPGPGGAPLPKTGSDRTPETLGRGGVLLTPFVPGWNAETGEPFTCGSAARWEMWDWGAFDDQVQTIIDLPDEQRYERRMGAIEFTLAHHTYERRVLEIVEQLKSEGVL